MYVKLAIRNARRSARDYLVYIVTMTICVTLFYSFLSISSAYYHPDIGTEYNFSLLSDGMKLAVCAITLLLLFLIRCVNHCMLRSKMKEFALQSIMGIEQKTLSRLFFAETFIMGLLSIAAGIFNGVFCSQFITAMLMTSYGKEYRITWTLFPDTVLLTVCFFVLSFLFVGIFNIRTIRKIKIIDMLSASKVNEPARKSNRQMPVILLLYGLLLIWRLAAGIQKLYFYYDSRFALPAAAMFWGNILIPAALIVWPALCYTRKKPYNLQKLTAGLMAGSVLNAFTAANVPFLQNRYYLSLGTGTINQYLLFLLFDLLFFLCAVIYLACSAITAWKDHSPEHRYRGQNLFLLGQITSKLSTTTKTMTLISVTLVLAIFLLTAAPILTGWASGYLDMRAKYDVQIFSRYNNVYEEEHLPRDDYEPVTEFLTEHGFETAYDCTFHLYLPSRTDFHNRMKYDFPAAAISLSDYNRLRAMLGYEPAVLKENEFTTQWKTIATKDEQQDFLQDHKTVTTDAGTLTLAPQASYTESIGETAYNTYTDVLLVFPDSVCRSLLPVMRNRYISTANTIPYEDARKLEAMFTASYPEMSGSGVQYYIRLKTLQVNSTKASNFVLQASMIYGAVVLMVICLTILSLQQLLDAGQYRYRFSVLRNLGVEEAAMETLVLKQLGVWFGLPVTVAVLTAAVIAAYFIQMVSTEITAYIGFQTLVRQISVTGSILILLLLCYFTSTWMLFRRSVFSSR